MILLNHWRVLSLCVCRLVCKFSAAWILIHRFTRKSHQFFRSKSHHSVSLLDPWKLILVSQYCTKVKTSDALFFFRGVSFSLPSSMFVWLQDFKFVFVAFKVQLLMCSTRMLRSYVLGGIDNVDSQVLNRIVCIFVLLVVWKS